MALPRIPHAAFALTLLLLAAVLSGQAPNQVGPFTVLSRDGRRVLPVAEVQGRPMVGLDDLSTLFQLQVREDAAANAVTATYRNQTLVLTPDQTLVSASGRLISLPSPLVRQGRRWLVPIEFISRALAVIYDTRLEVRAASRLVIVGDLRVPRVSAQYDESPGMSRITLQIAPRANAAVSQEPGRLLVRIEADTIDASLPVAPTQQGLLTAIRVVEPATIQIDLGTAVQLVPIVTAASRRRQRRAHDRGAGRIRFVIAPGGSRSADDANAASGRRRASGLRRPAPPDDRDDRASIPVTAETTRG